MSLPTEHATWQLYETYHMPVNVQRDRRTYDHFASPHARTMRQEQLLTTYMSQMIGAITRDIHDQGDCWLLTAIVQCELPAIHLLDRSAIACVYAACFTPDEAATPDTRTIPYSTQYCATPGGMRYTDRRARTCIIDLRADAVLQLLCHALLARAAQFRLTRDLQEMAEQRRADQSRMSVLCDEALAQNREITRLNAELCAAQLALAAATQAPHAVSAEVDAAPAAEETAAPADAGSPAQDDTPAILS